MDENTRRIQREIARDKIQIILSSIAVAVLIIMELYIMINYKSNFMFMAAGILLMIVALFFLISAVLDISLKTKDMEEQKYDEIYNAQKASYLVIKKNFDELEERLRNIEENSSLPAEDIINAQKAVAKVTISRSKENTDALMNSNDELINQLFSIKEKLDASNNQIIEKQQALLKESNFDLQQKIAELTNQISNIEGKIQNGIPVMAQPVQMAPPVYQTPNPAATMTQPMVEEPVSNVDISLEMPADVDISAEAMPDIEIPVEEAVEDLGLDIDVPVEEPATEAMPDIEIPVEEAVAEEPVEDLGLDIDAPVEEPVAEAMPDIEIPVKEAVAEGPVEDLGLDIDAPVEEPAAEAMPDVEIQVEEPVAEAMPDVEIQVEEPVAEAIPDVEIPVEEAVAEEPVEDLGLDIDVPVEEPAAEAMPDIETPAEASTEEIVLESTPPEESVDLDSLLEEVGGPVEEEPVEEAPAPAPVEEAPANDEIVIPDVGVDLTDPNRVMSAEEIEKLFANI